MYDSLGIVKEYRKYPKNSFDRAQEGHKIRLTLFTLIHKVLLYHQFQPYIPIKSYITLLRSANNQNISNLGLKNRQISVDIKNYRTDHFSYYCKIPKTYNFELIVLIEICHNSSFYVFELRKRSQGSKQNHMIRSKEHLCTVYNIYSYRFPVHKAGYVPKLKHHNIITLINQIEPTRLNVIFKLSWLI